MKAKKSFGQHFLTSEHISEKIAKSLTIEGNVLEVGPGKGMLTKYLLEKLPDFKAVEADKDMVEYLNHHYPQLSQNIIFEDFMKIKLREVFDGQKFSIIGNFPYNISSQIIFKMLDDKDLVPEMVGMFQKEMAERVSASKGGKDYGIIAVLTQAFYDVQYLFTVDKGSFNPPPKVQSAVIRLQRKENATIDCDEKLFRQVVKQTFNQRRKMLRNTVKPFVTDPAFLENPFLTKRPEQLSLEEFIWLTNQCKNPSDKV